MYITLSISLVVDLYELPMSAEPFKYERHADVPNHHSPHFEHRNAEAAGGPLPGARPGALPSPPSEAEGLTLVKDWTEAEERAAKRK